MSTDAIQNTNRLLADTAPVIEFLRTKNLAAVREATVVDWHARRLRKSDTDLLTLLRNLDLLEGNQDALPSFGRRGLAFLAKLLLPLDETLPKLSPIADRYSLGSSLASGKNSLAFRAEDKKLGRPVVLKFFRPGRGEDIIANVPRIGAVAGDPVLVRPLDLFVTSVPDTHGQSVAVNVMVFPFVDGMTIREYLKRETSSSPAVVLSFLDQVSLALRALERQGLHHGDLHPNNILVTTEADGRAAFRLIDISFGTDKPSNYELPLNDLAGVQHVLRIVLADIQSRLAGISLRRYLGARIFTLVEYVLGLKDATFEQLCKEIERGERFTAFKQRKLEFIRKRFSRPADFGILRYEELADPNIALDLFCPYPELFAQLCAFGSAVLFGHRGTGKSTYLAAMNFFPQATKPKVDFHDSFGILFSCRQGEFRKFGSQNLKLQPGARPAPALMDILVTKIIRKTLTALASGMAMDRLRPPKSIAPIADVLKRRIVRGDGLMLSHHMTEVDSLKMLLLNAEMEAIDNLFTNGKPPPQSQLLDEHTLADFFEAVRTTFSELNQARFSILFDDAGAPNVPRALQPLICDLLASTNRIYCVKLSAEKRTFQLLSSTGKPIERGHDVRFYTISDCFNMPFGVVRKEVEEYYRRLVGVRLKACGFQSDDIRMYLGRECMPANEIVSRLAGRVRGAPSYGGWNIVWPLADRTMRHLLEMISAIFEDAGVRHNAAPAIVPRHVQSRQILKFSEEKVKALMTLPGYITLAGGRHALGRILYDFAVSYGKIASFFLRSSPKRQAESTGKDRFVEKLAIELDDMPTLGPDATRILDNLIRFAVLDDEKMATSFDDNIRKPIYMFNRVYCPSLRMSFRRESHWRLSSKRFERFLLSPSEFVRKDPKLAKFLGEDYVEDRNYDLFRDG